MARHGTSPKVTLLKWDLFEAGKLRVALPHSGLDEAQRMIHGLVLAAVLVNFVVRALVVVVFAIQGGWRVTVPLKGVFVLNDCI